MRKETKIHIIGVDSHGLSKLAKELVCQSVLVVGTARLLAQVKDLGVPSWPITPLDKAMAAIQEGVQQGQVTLLASGDPLFWGIGRRLLNEFDEDQIEIHPALSSLQEAMAHFRLPWDDAAVLSLHGRHHTHLAGPLLKHPKTVVFTDDKHSPDILARALLDYFVRIGGDELMEKCRILVAENIGADDERLFTGTLTETAGRHFSSLNIMCLLRPERQTSGRLGLAESEINHNRGLITKDEVRAVTLHRLQLPKNGIVWDVGAGSGSVSIEAARMNPDLTVYAVEKKEEELDNIKANICKFGCFNIVPVAGSAPKILQKLPTPDRVFIGGSGGALAAIIEESVRCLSAHGRLVVNAVIPTTRNEAPRLLVAAGLTVSVSNIKITREKPGKNPINFNEISIIAGVKSDA